MLTVIYKLLWSLLRIW